MAKRKSRRGRARLVGVGLDAGDNHTRVTNGGHFRLYNGSARTHDRMQAKAQAFLALVEEKGLSMENLSRGEARQILEELGLQEEESVCS